MLMEQIPSPGWSLWEDPVSRSVMAFRSRPGRRSHAPSRRFAEQSKARATLLSERGQRIHPYSLVRDCQREIRSRPASIEGYINFTGRFTAQNATIPSGTQLGEVALHLNPPCCRKPPGPVRLRRDGGPPGGRQVRSDKPSYLYRWNAPGLSTPLRSNRGIMRPDGSLTRRTFRRSSKVRDQRGALHYRRASAGATWAARRAGTRIATSATAASRNTTTTSVTGSPAWTP